MSLALAMAVGSVAVAQTTQPAPAEPTTAATPASAPAPPQPAVADETPAAPTTLPAGPASIKFQFANMNLGSVVDKFVPVLCGKPLLGDTNALQGSFTYVDSKPYTPAEALSIINYVLRMNGYTIMDRGRYVELVSLKSGIGSDLEIIEGTDAKDVRKPADELVTAIIPLKYIDSEQAVALLARMVHNWGMLAKMPKGKSIVITDTFANIRRIQDMVQRIDKTIVLEQQIKSVQLKYASAEEVARILERILSGGGGGGGGQNQRWVYDPQTGRYVPAPTDAAERVLITADARSNTIIMIGPADKLMMAENVITMLDVDIVGQEGGTFRIFELKSAKAEDIAKTINAAIAPSLQPQGPRTTVRAAPPRIVADAGSNRLIVSATPDIMKQVEEIISKLDAVDAGGLRTFPLKNANAAALVPILQNALATPDSRGQRMLRCTISADPRMNVLIVNAQSADMEQITKLVDQFDAELPEEIQKQREIHIVRLEAGDARELADTLKKILADKPRPGAPGATAADDAAPRIEADKGTNSLIVSCPVGDWERINALLEKLKVQVLPQIMATTKTFPVKHANAGELMGTLQQVYDPRRQRKPAAGVGQPQPVPVVISYDSNSNAIIASASGEDMAEISKLIETLDVAGPAEARLEIRTYALSGANAVDVARMLNGLFAAQQPKGPPRPNAPATVQPRFEADPSSNVLVVSATAEQFKSIIDGLIEKVQKEDKLVETATRSFTLQHARSDQIVEAVRKVVEADVVSRDRRNKTQKPTGFQVSSDTRTNSLVVTAPGETLALVEKQLLPVLDADDTGQELQQMTKIVELANADPTELAAAINSALAGPGPSNVPGKTRPTDLSQLSGKRILVVAAPSSRALLLTGAKEDIAQAEELIKQLDSRKSTVEAQIETFPLQYAKADELARVLNETIGQAGGLKGKNDVPTRVSADRNANAVVVTAGGLTMERIADLIKRLDTKGADAEAVRIEIVPLQYAPADVVANAVTQAQPAAQPPRGPRAPQANAEEPLRATADVSSNSVLLTGRKAQIEDAKKLITQMDKAPGESAILTQLVKLENADPTEVATVMMAALTGDNQPNRAPRPGAPNLAALAGRRIKVVPAQGARSVLLTGGKEDIAFAQDLIKQLDQQAPDKLTLRTFTIQNGKADEIARVLNETIVKSMAARVKPGSVPTNVSADKNTNTLAVSASGEVVELVARLVKELDTPNPGAGEVRTEIVRLKSSKAEQLAPALAAALAPPKGGGPGKGDEDAPKVVAESISNSVLITARPAQIESIKKLIEQLDQDVTLLAQTKTFPLRFARASEIVPVLQAVLVGQARPTIGNRPGVVASEVRIAAQDKANAVVISAPPDVMLTAAKLIEEFDQKDLAGTVVQIVHLKSDPVTLAEAVNAVLGPDKQVRPQPGAVPVETVLVVPEINSNSVLIRGPKVEVDKALELIKSLDEGGSVAGVQVRTFSLKSADAVTVAKTLDTFFKAIITQANRNLVKNAPAQAFSIAADERVNAVIVSTNATYFAVVEKLLKEMDSDEGVTGREVEYIPLARADAFNMASQIDNLFADRPKTDRPSVTVSYGDNSLAVVAKEADLKVIQSAVEKADKAAERNYVKVKVFTMTPGVRPEKMAETLRRVYGQMTGSDVIINTAGEAPAAGGAENLFQPLVLEPAAGEADPTTRPTTTAPATRPATTLPAGAEPGGKLIGPSTQPTGKLITPPEPAVSTQPATTRPAGAAAGPPVVITIDKRSGALIVSAGRTEMDNIQTIIDQLTGSEITADTEMKVFKIKNGDINSIVRTLDSLFNPRPTAGQIPIQVQPQPRQGRGGGAAAGVPGVQPNQPQQQAAAQLMAALKPTIAVVADVRTRSVIVRAKPQDMDLIETLITELDVGQDKPFEVRVFALKNTDATEVASNLRELFGVATSGRAPAAPQPAAGGGAAGNAARLAGVLAAATPSYAAEQIRRLVELRKEQGVIQVEISANVTISANRATNSVVVTAPPDAMVLIADIVQELDQSISSATAVRTFKIQKAEVSEVVDVINRVFAQPVNQPPGQTARGQGAARGAVAAGNEAARMVVVSARADDFPLIEKVIKEIDEGGELREIVIKVYRLQYADARATADALRQTLTSAGGPTVGTARRTGGVSAGGDTIRISAETVANAVVVRAPQDEQERIGKLIAEMDQQPVAPATFQVIKLARADARDVSDALTRMIQGWPRKPNEVRPTVGYDRTSNSLMISGQAKDMERIAQLVTDLETGAAKADGRMQVQLIMLQHGKASEVAASLSQFYGAKAPSATPAQRSVTIAAHDPTGGLLVSGPAAEFTEIAAMVGKLDTDGGDVQKAVINLTYAQAADVAKAIAAAFAPPPGTKAAAADVVTASAEPATNSVVVSASQKNIEKIQALVKELDTEKNVGRKTEILTLTNARAADVAKALSDSLAKLPKTPGGVVPTVSAEPTSNMLILAGSKADVESLLAMAQKLDAATPRGSSEPQIIPLKKSDAVVVADMVNKLWQDIAAKQTREGKRPVAVSISADARSNAVVVMAPAEEFKTISNLINQLDEMTRDRNLRLIPIRNANPDDVMKAIKQLYGSPADPVVARPTGAARTGGKGAAGPQVTVLPEQRALLVDATDEDLAVINKLIAELEKAAEGGKREVMVFPLTKAPNTQVAAALNNIYGKPRANRPEDIVTVAALAGTNAVVVTAVAEKMKEIGDVIQKLDDVQTTGKMQIKTFQLVNASAIKILPLLRQMIVPIQQVNPSQPINITSDERANTIIVTTQANVFEQIESMIKQLDQAPAFKSAEVAVFVLKNADAPALAGVLTDILTPGTSKIQTPEARALQEQVRLLSMQKGHEGLPPLDLSKPIKITSDPLLTGGNGSNSLIITSTPENIKALMEIVALLDTLPMAKGVKLQVIHLKNSDAISVMTLLRDAFNQGQRLAGRPGSPQAGKGKPETVTGEGITGPLNITADARTNTLIIAGSDETVALAALIINDLDQQASSEFTEVRVFKLLNGDAVKLAPLIRSVFVEQTTAAPPGAVGMREYVTRLRMLREKEQPVQSEVARSHPTFVVQADQNANLLVIVARSDLMDVLAELVRTMDTPGAGSMNTFRIYPLKNADATRMATVINGLYAGPNAQLIRAEDKPTITVDTRTNSLVVAGSEKTFGTIELLLARLDAQIPMELLDIQLVPLQNADAATIAPSLQRLMDARVQREIARGNKDAESLRMVIIPDARSNYLIVGGSAEGYKLVADLAKQLDAAPVSLAGAIQIIPLTNANAGTLSAALVNLFNQRYAAVRDPNLARQKPVIVPDLRTNSMMVAATQDDSKVIKDLVEKLDAAPTTPAVELVVLPMKFNDAGAVGPMIQRVFDARRAAMTPPGQVQNPQDTVTIATDGVTNAMVVSASKENLVMIKELLAKVDIEPPTETGVVRMYALEHADATRVANMLRTLVQQGLYKPALVGAANNAIAQAREKVSITTDVRTNVLIVSASKENFAVIEEVIKRVDSADAWGLTGNIKLYLLKNADATRLGTALQQMFDRKRAAETATGGEPRSLPAVIVPDERTNSLLVAASNEVFDAVDALVAKLDTPDIISSHQFAVFPLKQATAATIEPVIRQLFQARLVRGGVPLTPLTVLSDAKTNSLIVGGDKSDLLMAEDFIKRLDKAPPPVGQTMRVFPILKADATTLAQTLTQLYAAQKPGGVSGVGIAVDARSNALLVTAGQGDMENIADLVAKLDASPVTDVTEIRIFTLRKALATQLATVLNDALTNKPKALTPVSPNRATWIRFINETPDGRKLLSSAIKEGIMVTPVEKTNSLLVQAPVDTMPLLASLIDALDNTAPLAGEIRVFSLVNADATQMARVLTDLFNLQVLTPQRPAAEYKVISSPTGAGEPVGESPSALFGTAEQAAMRITVDQRTNSLLVAGSKSYLDLVSNVIQQLDASPAEDRQTVVYRLKNAVATDIETALRSYLDGENSRIRSTLGANALPAARELLARESVIVAEKTSNTLLISGSPRFFNAVSSIVRELDQPAPRVLIQVLLVEVTLDNTLEFGVDWTYAAHPGQYLINTASSLGITGGPTSGLTFSVTGGDLLPHLRALQAQGRLEVLSRPQISADDNQAAMLNIGQEVPFITDSRTLDTGATINTVTYRPVGISINVTPHIGRDGFVRMLVNPKISSVSESTVQISAGVNALILDSREARTTVTAQDGHTIVIGGLITSKKQATETKVPLLGDIPLLGLAFKSTKIVKQRTELLIILTPHVVSAPADADILSNKEIRQLHLSRSVRTDATSGDLLNPLRDVTPAEVHRLENGYSTGTQPAGANLEPVVIPMTPQEREILIKQKLIEENQ